MRKFTQFWLQLLLNKRSILFTLIVWIWIPYPFHMTCALKQTPIRLDRRFVVKDYEIVYPVYVGRGETKLSANPYSGSDSTAGRHKRNARTGTTLFPETTSHLNVSGLGRTFLVKLESNQALLAPGFRVYYYGSNESLVSRARTSYYDPVRDDQSYAAPEEVRVEATETRECLYRGEIISHHGSNSRAAVSMCGGQVMGMLMTDEEDYVIEPVPLRQRARTRTRTAQGAGLEGAIPHIMYRVSSLRQRSRHYESHGYSSPQSGRRRHAAALEWPFDRRRRKRSAFKLSRGLTVELLVVADKAMYYAHKGDDVMMYALSIMNIVSQLYKDSSLGTTIKVSLVGLVIMQKDEAKLTINNHAGQTLQNFCQWQAGVSGTYGKHDHAVLLTSLDICSHKNAPCDTLGYAPIEGMCEDVRSCSVNEDTGLATGYTVAHEMGHNFGMFHDGEKNRCPRSSGTIMSPKLTTGGKGAFRWSSCSRDYLIKFLHTPQAKCLWKNSLQVTRLRFPQKLPGEIYGADSQCLWLFGDSSKHCFYNLGKNLCQHLWCKSKGHLCQTKFLPSADGTPCGSGKWCVQGLCVLSGKTVKEHAQPVDGGWSSWRSWSECSRTCGRGVMQRERRCDNPRPLYEGEPCEGISRTYRLCNTQECSEAKEEFRALQCRSYDRRPFHGSYYKWRPYTAINEVTDQCKLYCQAHGYDFITALSSQVRDGTACNQYSSDVCVQGTCKKFGCDLIIDSDAKEDNCGVCRGDNSTCRVVKGEFRLQPRLRTYFPITVIPQHSRHIHITEQTYSHNFVAIRDIYGNYYLNGDMRVVPPGMYTLGGAKFEYRRTQNMQESLVSPGPLLQDLVLEVLILGRNPGVLYDYTLPKATTQRPEDYHQNNNNNNPLPPRDDRSHPRHPNQYDDPPPRQTTPHPQPRPTPIRHHYSWKSIKFNCSEACAGGEQVFRAECWQDQRFHVNPGLCDSKRRPFVGTMLCNQQPCEPRWVSYEWRPCSRTCAGGKQVRKTRCRQKYSQKVDRRVDRQQCASLPKPTRRRWCNTQDCPAAWIVGRWSQCSATCGDGVATRPLSCGSLASYGFKTVDKSNCQHLSRHVTEKPCRLAPCVVDPYQWVVSSWSKCSTTCGNGVKTRTLRCSFKSDPQTTFRTVSNHYCAHIAQPSHVPLQEVCTAQPCPRVHWYTSAWTKCSASCGNGLQTRLVYCQDMRTQRRTSGCDWQRKPPETQRCSTGPCPLAVPYCADEFSWCHLVPKHNVCRHSFYGTRCCRSCRQRQRQ